LSADGDRLFFPSEPLDGIASSAALEHGGDIEAAEARYGTPREGWLDLSTGINPTPYKVGPVTRGDLAMLPQRAAEARLRAEAAAYFGLPHGAGLVAAAGSQALIQWLPRLFSPRRVAIVAPTYGEHQRAWTLAGHAVRLVADIADDAGDIVVIGNPNNPDGRVFAPDRVTRIAAHLAARGGLLVVDEAFADTQPELSVIEACDRPGLVVLRSFGKFFGLAGLRLGFAAAERGLASRLAEAIGPWPVSAPALAVATRAYGDQTWIAATRRSLARQAARRDRLLTGHGLARLGGSALFALYRHDDAAILADHFGRAGILVRRFAARQDWLRFGLPGRDAGWRRLRAALADWPREQGGNVRE
jgi:cobalamin biosynthetic protein CobC